MLIPTSQPTALPGPPELGTLYPGLRNSLLLSQLEEMGGISPVFWVLKNAH